eukprot:GHVU01225187.1.p1 GENE.GHVU01225187.1~~GHVU01225187.1.p1  ORF type:complete len:533 (-),score=151.90 GHVU01225187.1:71-1534(-)
MEYRRVDKCVKDMGGAVWPKLDWSAPKDATAQLLSDGRCRSAGDVFLSLRSSVRVAHDLEGAYARCVGVDEATEEGRRLRRGRYPVHLVLKKYKDLKEGLDFRLFCANGRVLAISQRDLGAVFPFLLPPSRLSASLPSFLRRFYAAHVLPRLSPVLRRRCVVDLHVIVPESSTNESTRRSPEEEEKEEEGEQQQSDPRTRARVVDVAPWGSVTDPLLFDWAELRTMALSLRVEEEKPTTNDGDDEEDGQEEEEEEREDDVDEEKKETGEEAKERGETKAVKVKRVCAPRPPPPPPPPSYRCQSCANILTSGVYVADGIGSNRRRRSDSQCSQTGPNHRMTNSTSSSRVEGQSPTSPVWRILRSQADVRVNEELIHQYPREFMDLAARDASATASSAASPTRPDSSSSPTASGDPPKQDAHTTTIALIEAAIAAGAKEDSDGTSSSAAEEEEAEEEQGEKDAHLRSPSGPFCGRGRCHTDCNPVSEGN